MDEDAVDVIRIQDEIDMQQTKDDFLIQQSQQDFVVGFYLKQINPLKKPHHMNY